MARSVLPTLLAALTVALAAGEPAPVSAQSVADWVPPAAAGQTFPLSIRSIMRGEANVGQSPAQIRWTDDSAWVYFRWQPGGQAWDADRALYRVGADGGTPERLSDAEAVAAEPLLAGGDVSPDGRTRVVSSRGDLYLIDRRSLAVRRLTHTEDAEGSPLFSDDGASVFFRRGDALFRIEIGNGALTQLTRIADGPAPSEDEPEGHRAFLEAQQLQLFEHIRRDSAEDARDEALDSLREAGEPATVHLERGERVQDLEPTGSGEYVMVRAVTSASEARQTIVPDWVTEDG